MRIRVLLAMTIAAILLPIPAGATSCYTDGTDRCFATAAECPTPQGALRCPVVTCETTPGCPGNTRVERSAAASAPTPASSTQAPLPFTQIKPKINFEPPTLQLSDLKVEHLDGATDVVNVPWLGEYLAAIYRWAIPVGAILAVVVIMIGGIIWLTSGGADRLSTAREWIGNAVIGLLLLVGSYVILEIINPDLVRFAQLQIRIARRENIVTEEEPDEVSGQSAGTLVGVNGEYLSGNSQISEDLLAPLQAAARTVGAAGFQISVTSSYRSEATQRRLILENCQNPPGSATCNPKPGKAQTCILRNGPTSCPHTTGRAIDAWGAEDGKQCIMQAACLANQTACRALPCQKAVIDAMRAQGFCNLASEPWHFELTKMSNNCS
ncbi:D-alanyl-D-alanine carboxypeptidase family protein [Candidatus Uhrbacteria bacterium]|nr:D-alanyl-D-alanine carboxypeptidase family protein [Candidatus Uhrbacteria bacterium]